MVEIVTAHEATRPAAFIKARKTLATTTGAVYVRIWLVWQAAVVMNAAMLNAVMMTRPQHGEIFRPVVHLVTISMMNLFTASERSAQCFLGYENVFVNVAI